MEADQHSRLRDARIAAGFESAAASARAHGWNEPTYRHHENGTAKYSVKQAEEYARAYHVKAEYLLIGAEWDYQPPVKREPEDGVAADVPSLGVIEDDVARSDLHKYPPLAFGFPGIAWSSIFAFELQSDAMNEFYVRGDHIFCVDVALDDVREGDHLAIYVKAGRLKEMLVREVYSVDGEAMVRPRSTRNDGLPTFSLTGLFAVNAVRVMGRVIGHFGRRGDRDAMPLLGAALKYGLRDAPTD